MANSGDRARPFYLHVVRLGEPSVSIGSIPAASASDFLGGKFAELSHAFNLTEGGRRISNSSHFLEAVMKWMEGGKTIQDNHGEVLVGGIRLVERNFQEKQMIVPLHGFNPYLLRLSAYATLDGRKGYVFVAQKQAEDKEMQILAVEQDSEGNWIEFDVNPSEAGVLNEVMFTREAVNITDIYLHIEKGFVPDPKGSGGGGTRMPIAKAA